MDITIESLATNPYSTVIGLVFTVVSVVIAVVFYLLAKKEKIPCFEVSSNTILEKLHKSLDGLEVHYKGEAQERITVTKVAFWNDGKETIDRNHLVEKDPLRLICPFSAKILDVRIVKSSAESNSVKIGSPVSDKEVTYYPLSLEYLDHREYFIIQIVHDGCVNDQFSIDGKIKGVKTIKCVKKAAEFKLKMLFNCIQYLVFTLLALSLAFFGDGQESKIMWVFTAIFFVLSIGSFYRFRIAPVHI